MQSDCLSFTVFLLVDPGVPYLIEAKDCFLAETRDRLKKRGSKGESYDDIIARLLDLDEDVKK